jgi:Zn-dependent peptidase ImmA (M78 family)/transcriptional regulator with XRE-family HTH domain
MSAPRFEQGRLRIARELAKLSQAQLAGKVAVSPAAISQFESGSVRPSIETVTALSIVLDVPQDFFAQPMTDTHEGFFRSLRRTAVIDRRRARAVAHIAHDLAVHATAAGQFPASRVPVIPADGLNTPRGQIEKIAAEVRRVLCVPKGPIADVVDILEDHGVVVIRLPLGSADVDAFSLPFADHPVIVLGTDKNDRARSRFDAVHELGHLVLHGEQIWGMKQVETQAHWFAAAFLMPADEICDQLPATVDWTCLFELKRHWQVSLAALLLRARTLGRMSESTYLTAIKTASARGWRRLEPVPLGALEQPRHLLNFLASPASGPARHHLPGRIVTSIATAATAA